MNNGDQFINISLNRYTQNRFYVRKSIVNALESHILKFNGILLDVGCGVMPYRNFILKYPGNKITKYIGLDLEQSAVHNTSIADLLWDGVKIPLESNSVDCAMATEVLEHCFQPELVFDEIIRVLKPGGVFFFTVPFLWPLHEVPYDEFRFTPFSIEKLLVKAGFDNIQLKALGGWDASLAQMLGLWVIRRPFAAKKRRLLSMITLPVIKYLIAKDSIPKDFKESTMITGIQGISYKK